MLYNFQPPSTILNHTKAEKEKYIHMKSEKKERKKNI
jgi:hypothetical protein